MAAFEANAGDFPQLETYRVQLAEMLGQLRVAATQQAALAASKQEESKRLRKLLVDGLKLATFMRNGARMTARRRKGAGIPNGIRTRVAALKGQSPSPLDDGDVGRNSGRR